MLTNIIYWGLLALGTVTATVLVFILCVWVLYKGTTDG